MSIPKSLGELLVAEGLLDEKTLAQAEASARRSGTSLVNILVSERLVGSDELFMLLRERVGIPEVELEQIVVDSDALRAVSLHFAEQRVVLPLGFERSSNFAVLHVAMADPLDYASIDEIETATRCRVAPVLAPVPDILAAVRRLYPEVVTKVMDNRGGRPLGRRSWPSSDSAEVPPVVSRTQPVHSLEDEAGPDLRIRALLNVLVARGIVSEEEYLEEIRALLKGRSEEG